jgi:hypothetical protein
VAHATYAQDMRQLLHFRRTLVSFRSRFCAKGWDRSWLHAGKLAYTKNPSKASSKKPFQINGAFCAFILCKKQLFLA